LKCKVGLHVYYKERKERIMARGIGIETITRFGIVRSMTETGKRLDELTPQEEAEERERIKKSGIEFKTGQGHQTQPITKEGTLLGGPVLPQMKAEATEALSRIDLPRFSS
jgi:hypothetical protein